MPLGDPADENLETNMKPEIATLKAHHIEDLRPIAKSLANLADQLNALLRRWEAGLNLADERPAKRFEPPVTPRRME
jgi:hypothetical protein